MMTGFDLQPVLYVVLVAVALFAVQRAVPTVAKWLVRRRTARRLAAAGVVDPRASNATPENSQ